MFGCLCGVPQHTRAGSLTDVAHRAPTQVSPDAPALAFGDRLALAASNLVRPLAITIALLALLVPPAVLGIPIVPLLCAGPLVLSATRSGETRAFRLWVAYSVSFLVFFVLRNAADELGPHALFHYPIAVDTWLLGTPGPALAQARWYTGSWGVLEAAAVGIHGSYFVLPPLAVLVLWWRWPARFPRYVVASGLMFLAAALVHTLVPTAPPWLAAREGHLVPITPLLQVALRNTPPIAYQYSSAVMVENLVAAMPSVHVAVTWLLVLGFGVRLRWLLATTVIYSVAMIWAVVYMGDHYLADALAGIGLASVCWVVAGRLAWSRPLP